MVGACGRAEQRHQDSLARLEAQRARQDSDRAADAARAWKKWADDSLRGIARADSERHQREVDDPMSELNRRLRDSAEVFVLAPLSARIVRACVSSTRSQVAYRYVVTNTSRYPVRIWSVGTGDGNQVGFTDAADGGGEVSEVPPSSEIAGDDLVDTTAVSAPRGWDAEVMRVEETRGFYIQWRAGKAGSLISPGDSASFELRLAPPGDSAYAHGHFTVWLDGPPYRFVGRLDARPCDLPHK